jgi:hypothetical protein
MTNRKFQQEKTKPRRTSYSIGDRDVLGIEFDAKFKGEEMYSRLFFVPVTDSLYRWMCDRTPQQFTQIPVTSISQRRKDALLEVWGQTREHPQPRSMTNQKTKETCNV